MAYNIRKADGTLVVVPDNTVDTQFYNPTGGSTGLGSGLQLIGRNAIDYGAPVAQSFLQLTENFASSAAAFPSDATAMQGQLWFNKTDSSLYVRVTGAVSGGLANWRRVIVNDPVNPSDGDVQVLSSPTRINIWANGAWQQVFPAIYS